MDTLHDRFMSKVAMIDTHWMWQGASVPGAKKTRYGVFSLEGASRPATAVSWLIFRGGAPEGAKMRNKCGITLCVNPDHIKPIASDEDKFFDKVEMTESCWLWTGAKDPNGYGRFGNGARVGNTAPIILAHRFSWELVNGPTDHDLLHNCPGGDNPSCVNPDHLTPGTHARNMADAATKDQIAFGNAKPNSRLDPEKVREIRRRFDARQLVTSRTNRNGQDSLGAIAKDYGVGVGTIYDVVMRKTWRRVV